MRGSCGVSATARNGVASSRLLRACRVPVQPAVGRALHARRRRFHVVLRVEVRPRAVRRSAGVDDGQLAAVPERLQRLQPRVEAEEAVEIDGAALAAFGRGIAMLGRAR